MNYPTSIHLISAVRDFAMYDRCIRRNRYAAGCQLTPIDNRQRNEGVGICYNRFLDSRPSDEDAWYVFCHEDFEPTEPLTSALNHIPDRDSLWGPIGAATRIVLGIYHQWQMRGSVEECSKDGLNTHRIGTPVPLGTLVETFDCQCIIVHSSLVQRHHLRFDEQLTFDLYAEDFCIAAHEKAGILSRIIPIAACHWSGGSIQPRYFLQESHLAAKYPRACYTGTSSFILGGNPPFLRRLTVALKKTVRKFL